MFYNTSSCTIPTSGVLESQCAKELYACVSCYGSSCWCT